jgi:DNA-directed RNA polymerase subunit beta
MTAEEELVDFLFDDEVGVEADNSDLLSDDYAGEDDGFDYEDEV